MRALSAYGRRVFVRLLFVLLLVLFRVVPCFGAASAFGFSGTASVRGGVGLGIVSGGVAMAGSVSPLALSQAAQPPSSARAL